MFKKFLALLTGISLFNGCIISYEDLIVTQRKLVGGRNPPLKIYECYTSPCPINTANVNANFPDDPLLMDGAILEIEYFVNNAWGVVLFNVGDKYYKPTPNFPIPGKDPWFRIPIELPRNAQHFQVVITKDSNAPPGYSGLRQFYVGNIYIVLNSTRLVREIQEIIAPQALDVYENIFFGIISKENIQELENQLKPLASFSVTSSLSSEMNLQRINNLRSTMSDLVQLYPEFSETLAQLRIKLDELSNSIAMNGSFSVPEIQAIAKSTVSKFHGMKLTIEIQQAENTKKLLEISERLGAIYSKFENFDVFNVPLRATYTLGNLKNLIAHFIASNNTDTYQRSPEGLKAIEDIKRICQNQVPGIYLVPDIFFRGFPRIQQVFYRDGKPEGRFQRLLELHAQKKGISVERLLFYVARLLEFLSTFDTIQSNFQVEFVK